MLYEIQNLHEKVMSSMAGELLGRILSKSFDSVNFGRWTITEIALQK